MSDKIEDIDVLSVFNSPKFLKKMVDNMDEKTRGLYEIEIQRKKKERLQNMEREQEARNQSWERQRLYQEEYVQRKKATRERELSILYIILKYTWLTYLILSFSIFSIRNFEVSYFKNPAVLNFTTYITSLQSIELYPVLCLPFISISIFTMIFFIDY